MLADRAAADAVLGACVAALGVAAYTLGVRAAAEGLIAVGLGVLALALPMQAPVPVVADGPVLLRVLQAPQRVGASCRALVYVHGRQPGRAIVRLPRVHCSLVAGSRVLARVRLTKPRPRTNPGGRDPGRRWRRRGVAAVGRLVDDRAVVVFPEPRGPTGLFSLWRTRIGDALAPPEAPTRAGGLLRALVTGQRDGVSPALRRAFAESGTAHLLAVSGLHVGWVFAVAALVARTALRRSRRTGVLRQANGIGLVCGVAAAAAYAGIAGFGVPALRAAAMATAGTLAVLGGRPRAAPSALAAAALLILSIEPAALFDISFALSFSAVAGILVWAPPPGHLAALGHSTAAAALATAPWMAALEAPLPAGSLVANALAIPLFAGAVVPLGLVTGVLGALSPEHAAWLCAPARVCAELGIRLVIVLESSDLLARIHDPLRWALVTAGTGFALRGCALRSPARVLGSALLCVGLVVGTAATGGSDDGDWVLALDVGHGDAIVVHVREQVWVIDAGPRIGRFDAGRQVVVPALRDLGLQQVDVLVLSHSDLDHLGGAVGVLERVPVGELWMSAATWRHRAAREVRQAAARAGVPVRIVAAGARAEPGVRVLWPPLAAGPGPPNSLSLVLRFEFEAGCALLAGDAPAEVEAQLARTERPCTLLKLAHHGSASSTPDSWLASLSPEVALVSNGRRTRAPLPAPGVRERLRAASVSVYETARSGAVRVRFGPGTAVAEPFLTPP